MKKLLASSLMAALLFAGCGGGDSDQDKVADIVIQAAEDAGASPDSGCIKDAAGRLSDDDAAALVDAGLQGDPTISADANGILADMLTC